MKTTCNRRQLIRSLFISLAGIVLSVFVADAAQEPYDIDLKELQRPPVRRAKEKVKRAPHEHPESVAATSNEKGESSSYIVRPGDHLFLILMQRYGLSNNAAEQLIPEIMRLNGIRSPKSLTVGQQLTIPLPPATNTTSQSSPHKPRHSPQPESTTVPSHDTETPLVREVVAHPAQPCLLARKAADQLGVHVPTFYSFMGEESISVSYNTVKAVIVCGRTPAETYTLKRLLTQHGIKLLTFKADEPPRMVIEGVAAGLGISFRVLPNAGNAAHPLTYLFPAAISGKDLRLTVSSDIPVSK